MSRYRGVVQAQVSGVDCEVWVDLKGESETFGSVLDGVLYEAGEGRTWKILSWPVGSDGLPRVVARSASKTFL